MAIESNDFLVRQRLCAVWPVNSEMTVIVFLCYMDVSPHLTREVVTELNYPERSQESDLR